jgi:hypothetical protein
MRGGYRPSSDESTPQDPDKGLASLRQIGVQIWALTKAWRVTMIAEKRLLASCSLNAAPARCHDRRVLDRAVGWKASDVADRLQVLTSAAAMISED